MSFKPTPSVDGLPRITIKIEHRIGAHDLERSIAYLIYHDKRVSKTSAMDNLKMLLIQDGSNYSEYSRIEDSWEDHSEDAIERCKQLFPEFYKD